MLTSHLFRETLPVSVNFCVPPFSDGTISCAGRSMVNPGQPASIVPRPVVPLRHVPFIRGLDLHVGTAELPRSQASLESNYSLEPRAEP